MSEMDEVINKMLDEVDEDLAPDAINPAHYRNSYPFEVIDLIQKVLTPAQFQGYLIGCELKYRLRAGVKTVDFEQDMLKALWYRDRRMV